MGTMPAMVLLLSDSRLPAGGHAHSAQLEAAAAAGLVDTVEDLLVFLRGRLTRGGAVAAAFAAAACVRAVRDPLRWDDLDAEFDARTASPSMRASSRHQGRTLVRAASTAWPSAALTALARRAGGPHHPLVVGCIAGATGCTPEQAALVAAYLSVSGPASAAVRLLGLDPLAVNAGVAQLAAGIDAVAANAAVSAFGSAADLPSSSAPLLDLLAEDHATWEVRLFAS
jgi:urease accessory protein